MRSKIMVFVFLYESVNSASRVHLTCHLSSEPLTHCASTLLAYLPLTCFVFHDLDDRFIVDMSQQ